MEEVAWVRLVTELTSELEKKMRKMFSTGVVKTALYVCRGTFRAKILKCLMVFLDLKKNLLGVFRQICVPGVRGNILVKKIF